MTKAILLAGLCLFLPHFAVAEGDACRNSCPTAYRLTSTSEMRNYGVMIAAPDTGCRFVRFRVERDGAAFLGHTPALGPGELAVVRMGRGFVAGDHDLTISSEGCAARPAATRRVTLAKTAPDHGWRAGAD
jgi:hypothetical protein